MGEDGPVVLAVDSADGQWRPADELEAMDRFTVLRVDRLQAAAGSIEAGEVDCVLAVHRKGGTDGLAVLRAVQTGDVPVVLAAVDGSEKLASRAIAGGVDGYVRVGPAGWADRLRNQIEKALETAASRREQQAITPRYRSVFDAMNEGMARHELVRSKTGEPIDYRILEVNEQYEEIIGHTKETVEGKLASEVYPGEEPPFLDRYVSVVETGEPVEFELKYSPLERYFHVAAFSPEPDQFATVFADVTERRAARAVLQEQTARLEEAVERRKAAEKRYRSLFENNPAVIWEEDYSAAKQAVDEIAEREGDVAGFLEAHPEEIDRLFELVEILDVNRKALEYYEADSKAELTDNLGQLMTEKSVETNRKMWQAVADGKRSFREETVSKTLEGRRRREIFELHVPEHVEDYERVYVTSTDITERVARERELQEVKERLELALKGADLAVWDWDLRTDDIYRDNHWAEILGYEPETVADSLESALAILHPEDVHRHERALRAHLDGEADFYECEYRMRTAAGGWKWIRNVGKILEFEDGEPVRAVGIHQDVDAEKRTRERLRRNNELLQAIDRILRHNLHNDMNVVQGYARTIAEEVGGRTGEHAETIVETSQKLLRTVDKEREVVETLSDSLSLEALDRAATVETVRDGLLEKYPEATIEVAGEPVAVLATGQLDRAIEELLENAIEHSESPFPIVTVGYGGEDTIGWVSVADEGPGIPEMERAVLTGEREISPLYHGSGFGLWLVNQIVDRSGGTLQFFEREPGSEVRIVLDRPGRGPAAVPSVEDG
ncbi:MAG: PAS domain-containing protein [Halodesulfurarchaeum sp.]